MHIPSRCTLVPLLLLVPLVLVTLTATVTAQEVPPPAKELARLDRLTGTWVGSGMAWGSPDGDQVMLWTSKSTARKVMGGHFLRQDTLIELGEPLSAKLAFISFTGWDAAENRYVTYEFGNEGELATHELVWLSDDTTLTIAPKFREGRHHIDRWVNKTSGDTMTMTGDTAIEGGAFFPHVRGTAKRVADAEPVSLDGVGAIMTGPSKEMTRLARCAGHYGIAGTYRMSPDQEPMPFEGTETVNSIFGGTVVEFLPRGEGYEGYGAMAWDARRNRYVTFGANNSGEAHWSEGWWSDDNTMVLTCSAIMMGQPTLMRQVMVLNDKGHLAKMSADAFSGSSAAYRSFEAKFEGPMKKGE